VKHSPTDSQRGAIEAPLQPLLVVAGPGSGKTFCLIERIRFLIERHRVAPERICAFTFTNKAAEEIATRLKLLGPRAALVRRTTIHKLCVDLLREHGRRVGMEQGFGIADDEYQMQVLWRIEANPAKRNALPKRFSLHRLRGDELYREAANRLEQYEEILRRHNLLDFDMLLLKARDLLLHVDDVAAAVRARWDAVLVDEFQDLNPVQYDVITALARDHRNVFGVGDYDQSIYGWAGAQPEVFTKYINDFGITRVHSLLENRRCPKNIFALARAFVDVNPLLPGFDGRPEIVATKDSAHPVEAVGFDDHDAEIAWVIDDIRRERATHGLRWGDFALLYRKHETGNLAESAMLSADIPCRLAHGRAIAEDPIVRYLAAVLRIILDPLEEIHKENFLGLVLPKAFRDVVKAEAEANCEAPIDRLKRLAHELPREDENGKKLRRAFWTMRNFGALGRRHSGLGELAAELLSQRVGEYQTALEREHLLIGDPGMNREAAGLAFRIKSAIDHDRPVLVPRLGGAEIPVKAILHGIGVRTVRIQSDIDDQTLAVTGTKWVVQRGDAEVLAVEDGGSSGLPLAVFKAGQILASRRFAATFTDYVTFDLETTGTDPDSCRIVEIAAVRVRNGRIVDEFSALVNPGCPIPPGASAKNHITDAMVAGAPSFAEVWPAFRSFCGNDIVVAHNGYSFDFKVLKRLAGDLQGIGTYDTLPLARELVPSSRRLEDLAHKYEVDTGQSHRALDDSRALAKIFLRLNEDALARARKTALVHLLDHLGVALALTSPHAESSEQRLFLGLAIPYALGGFSDCLEHYRAVRQDLGDATLPTVEFVIDALGGPKRMQQIRREKSADERYPVSMERIRRLMEGLAVEGDGLPAQINAFLERVALSVTDGPVADRDRVNLLTLHSTKGLEFSRVYILGVEDAQFLMGERPTKQEIEEARRLLYVGMTRTKDRLVLTRCENRGGRLTGGTQFLDEMGLLPRAVSAPPGRGSTQSSSSAIPHRNPVSTSSPSSEPSLSTIDTLPSRR